MSVNINKNSMLRMFTLRTLDGVEFWANDDLPDFTVDVTDSVTEYKDYDLVDSIAYSGYGNEVLWWGIALNNGLWNAMRGLEKFEVSWTDKFGFQNVVVAYGEEETDDFIQYLVGTGIDAGAIVKNREFDTMKVATYKRLTELF